jgi:hypothetical protein
MMAKSTKDGRRSAAEIAVIIDHERLAEMYVAVTDKLAEARTEVDRLTRERDEFRLQAGLIGDAPVVELVSQLGSQLAHARMETARLTREQDALQQRVTLMKGASTVARAVARAAGMTPGAAQVAATQALRDTLDEVTRDNEALRLVLARVVRDCSLVGHENNCKAEWCATCQDADAARTLLAPTPESETPWGEPSDFEPVHIRDARHWLRLATRLSEARALLEKLKALADGDAGGEMCDGYDEVRRFLEGTETPGGPRRERS